ncbi:hypothetical protein VTI28DRAFT_5302 [Corynascus sepedonium]
MASDPLLALFCWNCILDIAFGSRVSDLCTYMYTYIHGSIRFPLQRGRESKREPFHSVSSKRPVRLFVDYSHLLPHWFGLPPSGAFPPPIKRWVGSCARLTIPSTTRNKAMPP